MNAVGKLVGHLLFLDPGIVCASVTATLAVGKNPGNFYVSLISLHVTQTYQVCISQQKVPEAQVDKTDTRNAPVGEMSFLSLDI